MTYSQRANSITSALFTEGMAGKSKVSRLLTAGKQAVVDSALHNALVAVNEFQFHQPGQVPRVVHPLGGSLGGHLPVFPEEVGQCQFHRRVFR